MQRALAIVGLVFALGCSSEDPAKGPAPKDAGSTDASSDVVSTPDAAGYDATDAGERPLRLMTWNLETYPLTSATPGQVAQVFAELEPDLVAVQEVSDPQAFLALSELLPVGYQTVVASPSSTLTLGLVYRSQRVSVGAPELLFADDTYAFPRPAFKVKAVATGIGEGNFDFTLVNVHLKAQLDAESVARRKAACVKLDAWIDAALSAGPETEIVVLGDFNDELTDPAPYNVFSPFLDDPKTYRFLTLDAANAGEHTYLPFDSMIDHVLVTSDALTAYGAGTTDVLELEQSMSGYETTVSDHRPVLVEFGAP